MLLATALTASAVAAISAPIWQVIRAAREASVVSPSEPREVVVFVAPLTPDVRSSETLIPRRVRPAPLRASASTATIASVPPVDSVAPTRAEVDTGARTLPTQPSDALRSRAVRGPVLSPSAFTRPSAFGRADYESVMSALGKDFVARALALPPTQEQKDELYRGEAARYARAKDEHRPMPVGAMGAGVSLPLPLFSSGPSRKQRMRDSVIHQGNLIRLRRLEERALAKRDSIRVADSLARLSKGTTPHNED